jgi:aminoglycoside phosphotransferase family enzyme/predicted kinase
MTEPEAAQAAVIEWLADPRTHGLSAREVRRFDTHAAVVVLAGAHAYKVKRAVKYPYLDFSTLEKRKAAIAAEIEANKPFAPELYERMVAIARAEDGTLSLGGKGRTVEWALVMRRFDENATLDRIAERGGIDDALARSLGEAIAAAHARSPRVEAAPWIAALRRFVEDEIAAIVGAPEVIAPAEAAALAEPLRSSLARIAPVLSARGQAGEVRRGHGDLHLRNVALIDGRPVLFDALEFDPIVAAGDVLYDLAFLLMDLLARNLDRAASIVFNRYLLAAASDEHLDALGMLPFFLSLRAAIRARVALDRRKIAPDEERAALGVEARGYVTLALRLIAPPAPRLVAVGGLSGTGKSTIALGLAHAIWPAPGAVHVRSDIERKRLAGVGEFDRLPASAYTEEANAGVYARMNELAGRTLAAGHSALVDAVHARPWERAAVEEVARRAGVRFDGIWLELPLDERVRRIGARRSDASDADAIVARSQERYDLGEIRWHRVSAAGQPEPVVAQAVRALGLDDSSLERGTKPKGSIC